MRKIENIITSMETEVSIQIHNNERLLILISEKFDSNGLFIATLDHIVIFGKYINSEIKLFNNKNIDIEYLQNIRIFNENQELYLWRTNNGFNSRFRSDMYGEETEIIDTYQKLIGSDCTKFNTTGFTRLYEPRRGREIIIPVIKFDKLPLFIKIRNYIDYNKFQQAEFVDSRLVCFTDVKRNKVGGINNE